MSIGIVQKESQYTTDASPSWNGYNHQGKVGIYVALKIINELKLKFDECKSYELELEWLEDFSIKKNGNYVSIHQVKTYDSTAPSEYKDAIWLILAKILDFPHIEKGYLHTTKKLSKLATLKNDLYNYKPPTEKKKEDDTEEDKKKDDTKKKKNKAAQKYRTPRECHDYVKGSNRYDEAFSKFEVYTYNDSSQHCDMNEVEQKIKNQLTIIKTGFSTQEHLDRAYLYLLGMVDLNIRERHTDIQLGEKNKKVTINFQNIYRIATTNYEISSKEYVIYNLRNRFNKLKDEYLEDLMYEEREGWISEANKRNINKLIKSICELNDENFLNFCLKITPDNEIDIDNPEHIMNTLSNCILAPNMTDVYFEILKQILKEINTQKYTFIKKGIKNQNFSYLPTTIIEQYHPNRTNRLTERILGNSNNQQLHEIDIMITKHINLPRLLDESFSKNIPDPEESDSSSRLQIADLEEHHKRITKIKQIRLIDIEKAKGELNE